MSDPKFLVKSAGKVLGEFQTYYEAVALRDILVKKDKAMVIQDVRAAQ